MSRRAPTSRSAAGAAVAVTTVGVLPVYLVGVLSVQVGADLGIGPARIGLLAAAFFAASALASAFSGAVTERFGSATVMRACSVVGALAMLGVAALARETVVLGLLLVLAGVGNGAGQPASNALIAGSVAEGRQGLAFGVKQAAIPLSTLIAGVAIPTVAIPLGWRAAFVLAGVLALAVVLTVPRGEPDATAAPRRPTEASGPFHLLPLLVLSAGVLLAAASGNALGAFFVASAVDAGTEPGTAGLLAATASLAGVATRILLGWLADRAHARWLVVVAVQMAVGALAYVAVASGQPLVMAAGAVVGYCTGWAWAGLVTYSTARMHFGVTARATGITQAGLGLGSALGPLAFGLAADATSFATAWYATSVVSLAGAAVVLLGRRMLLQHRPALAQAHAEGRRPRAVAP